MAPRGLMVAAAVDEQVEVQLAGHGALPDPAPDIAADWHAIALLRC